MALQAGDIGWHRDTGIAAWFIRWAEARKYGKNWTAQSPAVKGPAYYNHVYMMVSSLRLIEATPKGVVYADLSEYVGQYQPTDSAWFRPVFADADGADRAVHAMQQSVGEMYDNLAIISDALYLLCHRVNVRFGLTTHATCSGVVAHALELAGLDLGDYETCSSPADVFAFAQTNHWAPVGV